MPAQAETEEDDVVPEGGVRRVLRILYPRTRCRAASACTQAAAGKGRKIGPKQGCHCPSCNVKFCSCECLLLHQHGGRVRGAAFPIDKMCSALPAPGGGLTDNDLPMSAFKVSMLKFEQSLGQQPLHQEADMYGLPNSELPAMVEAHDVMHFCNSKNPAAAPAAAMLDLGSVVAPALHHSRQSPPLASTATHGDADDQPEVNAHEAQLSHDLEVGSCGAAELRPVGADAADAGACQQLQGPGAWSPEPAAITSPKLEQDMPGCHTAMLGTGTVLVGDSGSMEHERGPHSLDAGALEPGPGPGPGPGPSHCLPLPVAEQLTGSKRPRDTEGALGATSSAPSSVQEAGCRGDGVQWNNASTDGTAAAAAAATATATTVVAATAVAVKAGAAGTTGGGRSTQQPRWQNRPSKTQRQAPSTTCRAGSSLKEQLGTLASALDAVALMAEQEMQEEGSKRMEAEQQLQQERARRVEAEQQLEAERARRLEAEQQLEEERARRMEAEQHVEAERDNAVHYGTLLQQERARRNDAVKQLVVVRQKAQAQAQAGTGTGTGRPVAKAAAAAAAASPGVDAQQAESDSFPLQLQQQLQLSSEEQQLQHEGEAALAAAQHLLHLSTAPALFRLTPTPGGGT